MADQKLTTQLDLLHFTSARAQEIEEMKQSLQNSSGAKMAFQRLPKHMRRRVMSRTVKRLPKRLHEVHLNQLKKSGMPPKQKRPSRKYRRRPNNLLTAYSLRQKKCTWLETHIWHAKRFHMINMWGCRLADRPCDKAFRACYRATSNHCLVQDISYFRCIEIEGPLKMLTDSLKGICDSSTGLSISAAAYLHGNREGETVLFANNNGVRQAIGTIYFHWKPINACDNNFIRSLWLWVHAGFYSEVLKLLQNTFDSKDTKKGIQVKVTELKTSLNRFRLTGPLSLSVLYNTLKIANSNNTSCSWLNQYLSDNENAQTYLTQSQYWKSLENTSSASETSPHHILSLTVIDPRCSLSQTKQKAVLPFSKDVQLIELPKKAAVGQIWDSYTRNKVKDDKISNADIAKLRSGLLVPGSDIDKLPTAIPVLVIQRPGNRNNNLGYSSGWDLIVPSGWGNTFWIALIMWGGRAGGLREFKSIEFECGKPSFLAPDTNAGKEEEKRMSEKYKLKYFNLPPNKRPNYTKLGINQPFNFNWKLLISQWGSPQNFNFCVLRDRSILQELKDMLCKKTKFQRNIDFKMNCLVPIRITLDNKGAVKTFARICLPKLRDLIEKNTHVEPLRVDKNQNVRKEIRIEHQVLLRKMRKKRTQGDNTTRLRRDVLQKYREQIEGLWLPEKNQNIRGYGSREVIGFVTMGDFSFTHAHCCAVGYVAIGAVKALLSNNPKNKVLLRNINSRKYHVGTIEVTL